VKEIEVTAVGNSVRIVYPKLLDSAQLVKDIAYCKDNYKYGKDRHWVAPRRDTVLVQYDRGGNNEALGSTMIGRRVARLHCMFKLNVFDGVELAFVQWFRCSRQPEEDTGMFLVTKMEEFEVIELSTIERSIHLIPQFGNIGTTRRAQRGKAQGLDVYTKFTINNQVDLDTFNLIY
jgi:hypothetical protein